MTGAERGTAIHAFMQSVPFDGTAPDLDAEVQRQIDARLLDAGLADKLDLDRVRPFFESAVWRRIPPRQGRTAGGTVHHRPARCADHPRSRGVRG